MVLCVGDANNSSVESRTLAGFGAVGISFGTVKKHEG
jgi:hypothetical protein